MLNKAEATKMVKENILPFWQDLADQKNGGFYGEVDYYGKVDKNAAKGGIYHARILWTFSAAYGIFRDGTYKMSAEWAKEFLLNAFFDKTHGGLYWLVDNKGQVIDTRKQFYNLAFGIYAFSEHFRSIGDRSSRDLALDLFDIIETYGRDQEAGGYIEACTNAWRSIDDSRLSEKDMNTPKSMNTHLHILEAYTTLLQVTGDPRVRKALETLLCLMLVKIITKEWHFNLFFDMNWQVHGGDISYGHDIEGSWLLHQAAVALGNENLLAKVKEITLKIANATYSDAIDSQNGGLFSGCNPTGIVYYKKEWWPQAEAIVGFYNAYELSGEQKYFDAAAGIWEFIQNHFVDRNNREWHNELSLTNRPETGMPKAGFWKCPYHNARACFEIIRRMDKK